MRGMPVGKEMTTGLGKITIADDVIGIIAGMAATECYGLVGMSNRSIQDGIAEILGADNLQKGVEVVVEGDEVSITLHIIAEYGTRITEVAHNVMSKVRYVVEQMTGLRVREVDTVVHSVRVNETPRKHRRHSVGKGSGAEASR